MNKLAKTLKYVFGILIFPYSFGMWLFQFFRFRKCIKILKNTINSNNDFYQYLEKLDSRIDWLGRVYTVQPIPKEFRDFTDDELYDITMRSLLPIPLEVMHLAPTSKDGPYLLQYPQLAMP